MSDHWIPGHDGRPRDDANLRTMPPAALTATQREREYTPDGVMLSGWWRRWVAYVIDGFIVGVPAGVLALVLSLLRPDSALGVIVTGRTVESWLSPDAQELSGLLLSAACVLAVSATYSILMTSRLGWTLGKRALGIRVRHRDHERLPTTAEAVARWSVQLAPGALTALPWVGGAASFWGTLDGLWAAWDHRRQAIHDKAAGTSVVMA